MCKRLLVSFVVLLLAGTISFALDPVGIFDDATDVGGPAGIGCTHWESADLAGPYRVTGGGSDIWNQADQMHFAYKGLAGDWRISTSVQWLCADNWWAKAGVALRASLDGGSIQFATVVPKGSANQPSDPGDWRPQAQFAFRTATNDWEGDITRYTDNSYRASAVGVQRFDIGYANISIVESIADFGSGWELLGTKVTMGLPQTALYGLAVCGNDNNKMAQARFSNVQYEQNPHMYTQIKTVDNPGGNCLQTPGFRIYTVKKADGNWGGNDNEVYQSMNDLLDGKLPKGIGRTDFDPESGQFIDIYEESRLSPFVNLYDSENNSRGNFANDESYPCIDTYEWPAGDPANGDGDDHFATDASACIQLTAGYHIIGVNSDDGCIIKIGGTEIGRTGAWKGTSNESFLFNVLTAGLYSFNARNLEGGGGAAFELYEILANGSMVLLGDTEHGGSPVYVPEPATVALLGLGGMSLLGIRRKR
jgi:hypothetical protein